MTVRVTGLFGYAGPDALIQDAVLTDVTIEAGAQTANSPFVENSESSAEVTGKAATGDLIG